MSVTRRAHPTGNVTWRAKVLFECRVIAQRSFGRRVDAKRWEADQKAFALLPPDAFEQLQAQGVPMEVLARDSRRVIVRKPQP